METAGGQHGGDTQKERLVQGPFEGSASRQVPGVVERATLGMRADHTIRASMRQPIDATAHTTDKADRNAAAVNIGCPACVPR